ncbi:hypothetical protein BGW80DRAFT_848615 [Lactifluus volemus]|nr:hypothetical protein BGW80DRAFT_848615 [Lactifluus volemus]
MPNCTQKTYCGGQMSLTFGLWKSRFQLCRSTLPFWRSERERDRKLFSLSTTHPPYSRDQGPAVKMVTPGERQTIQSCLAAPPLVSYQNLSACYPHPSSVIYLRVTLLNMTAD